VAYSVTWAESAIASVAEEAEYIARDSPSYAATLIAKAEKAANSLFQFPNRGRVVPEYSDEAIRELFVDRYRLIYRVRESTVLIAAFVHGSVPTDLSVLATWEQWRLRSSNSAAQQANPADTRLLRGPAAEPPRSKSKPRRQLGCSSSGWRPQSRQPSCPRDGGAASRAQLMSRSLAGPSAAHESQLITRLNSA